MANEIAYGFHKLEDIFDEQITNVSTETLDEAVFTSAALYEDDLNSMLELMVTELEGNSAKKRVEVGVGGELQPLSENGTPIPERHLNSYEQGWPFMRGGSSFGFNRESYAKATVATMNKKMIAVQKKDAAWNIRRLLAALYTETTWTYNDPDDDIGALSVKGLANGDTDVYLDQNGNFATDDHYLAQANAIDNSNNPFPTLYEELYEHPTNMGPFVALIPQGLTSAVKALSAFNYNPYLTPFVDYGQDVTLANPAVEQYLGFGTQVLGEVDQMIVVESRRLPAGYILAFAAGNDEPVLKMREEPEASLRGLQMSMHKPDSNFTQWDFYRKRGYAVWDRTAAAVMRIGNGTYAIPTGYDASTLWG